MVDDEAPADGGARVDVHAGALVGELGEQAGQQRHAQRVQRVRHAEDGDGVEARVGEDDFIHAARGGVGLVDGLRVLLQPRVDVRQLLHEAPRERGVHLRVERRQQRLQPDEVGLHRHHVALHGGRVALQLVGEVGEEQPQHLLDELRRGGADVRGEALALAALQQHREQLVVGGVHGGAAP